MKYPYNFSDFRSLLSLRRTLMTLVMAVSFFVANAQVGVGTISPDASAQLDIQSTSKGILIPRMIDTERANIVNPATGLLVYQTNGAIGFYFFDGTSWQPFSYGPSPAAPMGFSATAGNLTVTSSSQISAFSTLYSEGGGFEPVSGNYIVPASGIYRVSAVVNYATAAALSASLGAGVDPRIALMVNGVETLTGLFPILNVNVALVLTLRTILGNGAVVISGDIPLEAGDVLGLEYLSDGLTVNINLGGGGAANGVVWSVRKQ